MNKFFTPSAVLLLSMLICFAAVSSSSSGRGHASSSNSNSEEFTKNANTDSIPSSLGSELLQEKVVGQLVTRPRQDPELAARFRNYDLIRMSPRAAADQVRKTGNLLLNTSRGSFEMEVMPHDIRSSDYVSQMITADGVAHKLPRTPANTYKGVLKGEHRTQVRLSVNEDTVEGLIITERDRFFLQPAKAFSKSAQADEFVVYSFSEIVADEAGTCGVTLAEEVATQESDGILEGKTSILQADGGDISNISPMKVVRLATDADGEYVVSMGGVAAANARIVEIMNFVVGIYELEIGVTFEIVFQNAWPDQNTDPYTATFPGETDMDEQPGLLRQFRTHWNANFGHVNRSIAHLFTGKDLDDLAIGIAYTNVVCRAPDFAYGLSQKFPLANNNLITQAIVLTAHEIGHNFSAAHPNQPDEHVPLDFETPCDSTIMESSVGNGSNFCPFSRSQIIGHATAYGSCLMEAGLPPTNTCTEAPIATNGVGVNGAIENTDCKSPSRGVRYFADRYSFNANAGTQIAITYAKTSGTLDPYIYLIGPDGYVMSQDNNSGGGTEGRDSRIPASGHMTLPLTGKYIIEATSFDVEQTGNYTITVGMSNCTLSINPASQHFPAGGGNGMVNVTATGSCGASYRFTKHPDTAAWLQLQVNSGVGTQSLGFSVAANTDAAGRRAFLGVGAGADGTGGMRIPITQSGTGPDCMVAPITFGQTLNGTLSNTSCHSPIRGNGFLANRYTFTATAGQQVSISQTSTQIDTFLTLLGPNGVVIINDDDGGGGTNSRIPGGSGPLTLNLAGMYTIETGTFSDNEQGTYALTLNSSVAAASTIQFTQAAFNVLENAGSITVNVTRTGDTSGAATVDYTTSDMSGANNCNVVNGSASSRCDYGVASGKLRFAAGETSKTISILIIDDSYMEGDETFSVVLSNPTGATLGVPSTATVTINDNDAANGQSPIDQAGFFVRQHYIDFLNREPDAAGLAFWTNEIASCGADAACIEVKRINVSAAFYLSIEFQETGYLVYRMYKAAFGNIPGAPVPIRLLEFLPDTQEIGRGVVVGQGDWQTQLENNKNAFAAEFVKRVRFTTANPGTRPSAQFVDTLNQNAGGVLSQAESDQLVNDLISGAKTRAQVLRAIAEDADLVQLEFNKAFVLMQYFGYLRRNPNDAPDTDFSGYNFWLGKLNDFNGNFVNAEMVKAFIVSGEYRQRFGQ